MNTDPVMTALREISETKNLLASLLIASETFDYPKARLVLKALQQKVRDLTRLQLKLEKQKKAQEDRVTNICVLDFKHPKSLPHSKDLPHL